MTLNEKILNDIKDAMRAHEADKLSVLRMLKAALMNKTISLRAGLPAGATALQAGEASRPSPEATAGAVELTDEQVQEVIVSEVKKRRDSAIEYRNASRPELAEKEESEVSVLEAYLPAQLSDEELEQGVRAIIEIAEKKEFGMLMKDVMAKYKGQVDGRRAGEMIKKLLS